MYTNKIKEIDALKKEIDSFRPLKRRELKELKQYYRIALTATSNAIEGNVLNEAETKVILQEGVAIGGKPVKDHLEVLGHSDAYDLMLKLAKKRTEILEKDICALHKLFYFRIGLKQAGKYRKDQVFITGTDYVPPAPEQLAATMKQLVAELPALKVKHHPVEFAALLHLKLISIHPFIDGNGPTSRLAMNLALKQAGYPVTIIQMASRPDYYGAIRQTQVDKNPTAFTNFISMMAYESMQEYLRMLKAFLA